MNYKSAQVSIFIVISIILLVLGIIAFTFFNPTSIFEGESATFRVQEFTQACLNQQVEYAFNEVGKKGGWYYSTPGKFYAQPEFDNELVKSSQGFNHLFYEELDYWNYYDENSNSMQYNIPSLNSEDDDLSIRNQVSRLVEETINEQCLQDYASFSDSFEIEIDLEKLEVSSSSFERDRIVFDMFLPITVKERNEESFNSMTSFQAEMSNPIKIPYYIARDIIIAQQNTSFIEEAYLDFIYNYQVAGDNSMLPPFYDFRYGVTDYSIIYSDEKKPLLQQIFDTHSSEVIITDLDLTQSQRQKVTSTQQSELKSVQTHQKNHIANLEQSFLEQEGLSRDYQDYVAKLQYDPFFPISFSFSNGKGNGRVLTHNVFNELLLIVPIQHTTYQAGYDITLPTIYEISNTNEEVVDDDFIFNLPLEINIRNNNPLRVLRDSNLMTNSYDVSDSYTPSYCRDNQMISEDVNVKVSTRNKFDELQPLEDVEFEFRCSAQPSTVCSINNYEDIEQFNSQEYSMQLPINCPNSQLTVKKDGYVTQVIDDVSPSLELPLNREVELHKPKTLDLYFSVAGNYELDENQEAFIMFEPRNNPEYIEVFNINSSTNYDNLNVTLVPDTYTITSFTFDSTNKTIPKKEGRDCKWYEIGCKDAPDLPPIDLDGWVLSSFNLENYEIRFEDLQFADRVEAEIPGISYPRTYDEFNQEMPRSERRDIRIE